MSLGRLIADDIINGRSLLALAQSDGGAQTWERVLAYPKFWEIRHDRMNSVVHMSDEELRQAIVADLVFVRVEALRGALGSYPMSQLFAHLGNARSDSSDRIMSALHDVMEMGLLILADGRLSVPEGQFEQAQEFSGVYLLDPMGEQDIIDDIMIVGGRELLADTMDDLSSSVASPKF